MKSIDTINARSKIARNHTGKLSFSFQVSEGFSSEGSLTQHIKLKHPDYFAKMGLTQINLKSLDDSKSLNESDLNVAAFMNSTEEAVSKEKEPNRSKESNKDSSKKPDNEASANNNSSSLSNDVYIYFNFL